MGRAVTAVDALPVFPLTPDERRNVALEYADQLMLVWIRQDFPIPGTNYYLVYRPGEIAPDPLRAAHILEQSEALAAERGGVAVVITLTDDPTGAEEYVALTAENPRPGSS